MKRTLLLVVLALALMPAASAAALIDLENAGDAWNGISTVDAPAEGGTVTVWLPSGARLQGVEAVFPEGPAPTSWRAAGSGALLVESPPNATEVRARFDFGPRAPVLAEFVAPAYIDRLDITVTPPEGHAVTSETTTFGEKNGRYHATLTAVAAGQRVDIRVVDQGRVGELSVLASLVVLSVIALVAGVVWHKIRPPNEGREPTKFLDHLGELQARIIPPVVLFGLLNLVYFTMGLRLIERRGFRVLAPVMGTDASLSARAFDAFAERLVPAGVQLIVTRPVEAVFAQVQTALFLAFLTVLPLLLYELMGFFGPALLPKERRLALQTLPLLAGLFLGGALFGLVVMAPLMIDTLYSFAPALGAAPLLVISDLVSFTLLILLVFGVAFELPVAMYALTRFGLVQAKTYRRFWRHAIVVIFLVGGIITPDPSLVSQALVSLPLTALYLLGSGAAVWAERARAAAA